MDYWGDRHLEADALKAIQLRRRRWDAVTIGLVAAAMLLSGHAVHEWLQQRYLASANSKVEGNVRKVASDIENKKNAVADLKRQMEQMVQVKGDPQLAAGLAGGDSSNKSPYEELGKEHEELEKLRAEHGVLTAERKKLQDDSNAVANVLKKLGEAHVPFMQTNVKVYALDPSRHEDFDLTRFDAERIKEKGSWRLKVIEFQHWNTNTFGLQKNDEIVTVNGNTLGHYTRDDYEGGYHDGFSFESQAYRSTSGWVLIVKKK